MLLTTPKKKTHLIFQRESKVIFMATFIKWSGLIFENEPIVYISLSKDGLDRLNFDIRGPQSLSISLLLSGSGWIKSLSISIRTLWIFQSLKPHSLVNPFTPEIWMPILQTSYCTYFLLAVCECLELHRDNILNVIV